MEHKTVSFKLNTFSVEDGTFDGHASIFGNVDLMGDIVMEGAFTKTLKERSDDLFVAWMHDWAIPIGKPLVIEEDKKGLYIKAKISETTMGKDALILMRDGVVKKLSIGYDVIKQEWGMVDGKGRLIEDSEKAKGQGTPVRLIKELRLYEVSIVTVAANPAAQIMSVKEMAKVDKNDALYTIEEKAAIPYKKTSLAEEGMSWDAAAEMAKAESPEEWRAMCAMVVGDPEQKGSYKLPHHTGDSGHACVWNGVRAAAGALQGARSQVQGEGQDGAKSHIAGHYRDFDKGNPPWASEGEKPSNEKPKPDQEKPANQGKDNEPPLEVLMRQRLVLKNKLLGMKIEENGDE